MANQINSFGSTQPIIPPTPLTTSVSPFYKEIIDRKVSGLRLSIYQEGFHLYANKYIGNYKNELKYSKELHEYRHAMRKRLGKELHEYRHACRERLRHEKMEHNKNITLLSVPGDMFGGYLQTSDLLNFRLVCTKASEMFPKNSNQLEEAKRIMRVAYRYPQMLVEALGGERALYNLPVLEWRDTWPSREYIDLLQPENLQAPIMRGMDRFKRPFIAICFMHSDGVGVATFFQRCSNKKNNWAIGGHAKHLISMNCSSMFHNFNEQDLNTANDRLRNNYKICGTMSERLKRLVEGKSVGAVKQFKTLSFKNQMKHFTWGINGCLYESRPEDAYFENPRSLNEDFYETRPEDGKTDIVLWDPSKSREENIASFRCVPSFVDEFTGEVKSERGLGL